MEGDRAVDLERAPKACDGGDIEQTRGIEGAADVDLVAETRRARDVKDGAEDGRLRDSERAADASRARDGDRRRKGGATCGDGETTVERESLVEERDVLGGRGTRASIQVGHGDTRFSKDDGSIRQWRHGYTSVGDLKWGVGTKRVLPKHTPLIEIPNQRTTFVGCYAHTRIS